MEQKKLTPIKAIRAKCLDCCCGSSNEVKLCTCETCALWPYRLGTNPYIAKRELTDEQREAARERMYRLHSLGKQEKTENSAEV